MGSRSSSSSRQQTNNTSTTIGVSGDNQGFITNGNGNSFNITSTDGGLIDGAVDMARAGFDFGDSAVRGGYDLARDVNQDSLHFAEGVTDQFAGLISDGFSFGADVVGENTSLARDSIMAQNYLAETSIDANSELARDVAYLSENMHATNTDFARDTLQDSLLAIDNSSERVSEMAYFTANNSSNLARDVIAETADAYEEAGDQTLLAHKQALQFANDASRSDGQQLAISTNKTMMYIGIAAAGAVVLVALSKGTN
ncbi:hypothetical protein FIU82_07605 [Pseudoalteromonas sp. THAF3]|uniref:hypothetical protein n=1 Tax=Pseudoalteromonas sp. THAF3 TaxID=2587843 RepID=UPI001268D8FD|nr:hypothetical protein [Pseudoalteromonas sp. THAF3]QFU04878.1 hypothetical protein FIU82_07605 [Pseudoalteromonas sp. THAF3]